MPKPVERGSAAKHSTCTSPYYRVKFSGYNNAQERVEFTYFTTAIDAVAAENRALSRLRSAHPHCAIRTITVAQSTIK